MVSCRLGGIWCIKAASSYAGGECSVMAEIGEVYLIGTACNRRMNKSAETTKTDDQIPAASFVVAFPSCLRPRRSITSTSHHKLYS